ncbi:hypothetical protein, partial [Streptococcus suis]|uniref:hypothetical protein n=2 Tax=Streptococcus suis TaxID=1307 RepID=UPI001E48A6E2
QKGSIISTVVLPTTEIIEPKMSETAEMLFFYLDKYGRGGEIERELVEDKNGTIQSRTVIWSGYSNHDSC